MIFERRRVDKPVGDIQSQRKKPTLRMIVSGFYLPKQNTEKPQGEDAYFICSGGHQTLGVADGVGGWALQGIDSGQYARDLMENAALSVLCQPRGYVDPRVALNEAFSKTKAEGSSTACIATLKTDVHNSYFLHAVNVGDSGLMLYRNKRLIYQSPLQQHCFNMPYQLGNNGFSDTPESASEFEVGVEAGDIMVMGTDGLFDNMYASQMEDVIESEIEDGREEPENLAMVLAKVALYNSRDDNFVSPFQEAAQMAGAKHRGGKIDDITVLVARIVSCN